MGTRVSSLAPEISDGAFLLVVLAIPELEEDGAVTGGGVTGAATAALGAATGSTVFGADTGAETGADSFLGAAAA